MIGKPRALTLLSALALVVAARLPAFAQSYKAEKLALAAPQEIPTEIRAALSGDAVRVTGPNGVVCELWLRVAVPSSGAGSKPLIAFPQITEGTLIGAIRFPSGVVDYRGQGVKAGVYLLRYALIPEDGNHSGSAPPQRDFVVLTSPADDKTPATITRDQALDLSRKVTGYSHPTPWSLWPSKVSSASELPAMTHIDEPDCWQVNFLLPFEGGSSVPAALVVVGYAP